MPDTVGCYALLVAGQVVLLFVSAVGVYVLTAEGAESAESAPEFGPLLTDEMLRAARDCSRLPSAVGCPLLETQFVANPLEDPSSAAPLENQTLRAKSADSESLDD